jgi:hypothetical protein
MYKRIGWRGKGKHNILIEFCKVHISRVNASVFAKLGCLIANNLKHIFSTLLFKSQCKAIAGSSDTKQRQRRALGSLPKSPEPQE